LKAFPERRGFGFGSLQGFSFSLLFLVVVFVKQAWRGGWGYSRSDGWSRGCASSTCCW
jgi:hypothetical protein